MKYAIGGSILVLLLIVSYFVWGNGAPQTQPQSQILFGFITNVEGNTITFDEARWLTGKEGEDAAIAAGLCTEATRAECLPNDFYILNDTTTTQPLTLADDVVIAMATLNMETDGVKETQISPDDFSQLINNPTQHWSKLPYQMIVEDGKITILEEVYVP